MSIDTNKKTVTGISDIELKAMKNLSAYALPNTPANSGMKAPQVKPKFYDFALGNSSSLYSFFNRAIKEINEILESYYNNFIETEAHIETYKKDKKQIDSDLTRIDEAVDKNKTDIASNKSNIDANDIDILNNAQGIQKNKEAIVENAQAIKDNTSLINSKSSELSDKVNANLSEAKSYADSKVEALDEELTNALNEHITQAQATLNDKIANTINDLTALINLKQNKELSATINFNGTSWTTVEGAIQGLTGVLRDFLLATDKDEVVDTLGEIQTKISEFEDAIKGINTELDKFPTATKMTKGIVQIGDNIDVNNGVISVDMNSSKTKYSGDYSDESKSIYYGKTVEDALDKIISDINYIKIAINSFSVSPSLVELGTTVTEVNFTFAFNRTPASVTLDGSSIATNVTTHKLSGLSLTAYKAYTLKATDERNASASKSASISFYNGVYYGTSDVISENTKKLSNGNLASFTVDAGEGQYIYYAIPSRFATPSFWVGGFEGGFSLDRTEDYTNPSGYTESYNVYKSTNAGLGSTKVEVK